jgi:thioredoxin 1
LAGSFVDVTDATFEEEVVRSDIPVLVDFWAEWCRPCRLVIPALEEIAELYSGKIKIAKCNVDTNRETPSRYGVKSIPTLLLFIGGRIKETLIGALPQNKILKEISKHI